MTERVSRRSALQMLVAGPPVLATSIRAAAAAQAPSTPSAQPRRLPIGIVSRHLQWTSLEDAVALAAEAGFDAIEWNVRSGGHVAPERVERELPRAVELTRQAGLAVTMITTSIQDAQSAHAEAILATAQGLGIRYYRGGEYFRYDYNRDLVAQLEALKPRVAGLAALNQKYGTTWAYHTHSAPGMIGGSVWDIWSVIKDFDPALIGLNYDTGHTTARGGVGWIDAAHVAHRQIACVAIKDVTWQRRADGRWASEFCPVGEGMVNVAQVFGYLATVGFAGPVNIHYEHHGLLGTDVGKWQLDLPRQQFLAIVTHDLAAVRAATI
jgi:sugar phosphate isomerase/epimerase